MLIDLRQSLFDRIAPLVASALREPPMLDPGSLAEDIAGWDSHATVEIIFAVEDHFGFQMTSEQMEQVTGIASLIDIVAACTDATGSPA